MCVCGGGSTQVFKVEPHARYVVHSRCTDRGSAFTRASSSATSTRPLGCGVAAVVLPFATAVLLRFFLLLSTFPPTFTVLAAFAVLASAAGRFRELLVAAFRGIFFFPFSFNVCVCVCVRLCGGRFLKRFNAVHSLMCTLSHGLTRVNDGFRSSQGCVLSLIPCKILHV